MIFVHVIFGYLLDYYVLINVLALVIVAAKLVNLVINFVNFYCLKKQRSVFGIILGFLPKMANSQREIRKKE